MPKKVLIALPPNLLEKVDYMAQQEHRTRSDLIREALRRYEKTFDQERGVMKPNAIPAYAAPAMIAAG